MRKLTFIVNPVAGGRRQRAGELRLIRQLREAASDAEILVTERPGQALDWARERRWDDERVVVAAGGDGTVHEVGGGLIGGRAALGVLPVGSGNDFAKMLDTPADPGRAVEFFHRAEVRACDVGEVRIGHRDGRQTQHYFLNGLGIGYEAVVADAAARARLLSGAARYVVAALWHLVAYRPPSMTLKLGESTHEGPMFLVAVGNGRCAGGRFYLTPGAVIDDGLLDVCFTQTTAVPKLLRRLLAVFRGRHGRFSDIATERTEALEIACAEGCMAHADGELLARRAVRMEVRVLPGVLPVAVSAGSGRR
ncbi:MAG: diacylglycerol/lipid kinase family protein [Wenzhouxiangella sp.]